MAASTRDEEIVGAMFSSAERRSARALPLLTRGLLTLKL
jgi:hypothetical protein